MGRHRPMHARRQSQAHKRIAANVSPRHALALHRMPVHRDVGKTAIVVFDTASGATRAIANEPQALSDFAASLEATCFVVCEATGGYERDLLAALIAAGVPACRADARKVKAFIRSFGTLGKSDAIDATAAEDPKSNESCSWPQSPPQNTTRPSAPSTNVLSAGKKPLVAITAIMRKLVVIANAKLRTANALQVS
jgi:transposase